MTEQNYSKYLAISEKASIYRASRGGVFVTEPVDSMDKINKALKSPN